MNFNDAFAHVVGNEGGYDCSHDDAGNWTGRRVNAGELRGTKYGISAAAFPNLNIRDLTLDQAREIYRANYWNPLRIDDMPDELRLCVFDYAVNSGVHQAAVDLQESVGASVDGIVGPNTLAQVRARPVHLIRARLLGKRLDLLANHRLWPTRGRGWTLRVSRLLLEI